MISVPPSEMPADDIVQKVVAAVTDALKSRMLISPDFLARDIIAGMQDRALCIRQRADANPTAVATIGEVDYIKADIRIDLDIPHFQAYCIERVDARRMIERGVDDHVTRHMARSFVAKIEQGILPTLALTVSRAIDWARAEMLKGG